MRLLSYWKRLIVKDGILYLKSTAVGGETYFRLVIPKHMRDTVLKMSHDDLGHLGRDKTLSIAQERYFWVGLPKSVDQKIKSCRRCLCAKAPYLPERAPLVSIETTRPLELVCIDFLSLEESKGNYRYLLVITDHFTNYAQAYPTRNQEAKTVAKILVENFVVHYGLMEHLHSDLGGSFEAKVIKHMCKLLGIDKSHTTPFHPMGNAKTERFNRTLLGMLRTLDQSGKENWKDHVAYLVHAYNCCKQASTGYAPFYLMFGRCPRLPIDIFLGIPEKDGIHGTAKNIRANLEAAYKIASDSAKLARVNQTKNYNKKVRGNRIDVGDLVLTRNVNLKGKHKLADKWCDELYIVVKQPNVDIPVFVVRPENGGREKILHRNMLLPLILPWPQERSADFNHDTCYDDNSDNDDNVSDLIDLDSDVEVEIPVPHSNSFQFQPSESVQIDSFDQHSDLLQSERVEDQSSENVFDGHDFNNDITVVDDSQPVSSTGLRGVDDLQSPVDPYDEPLVDVLSPPLVPTPVIPPTVELHPEPVIEPVPRRSTRQNIGQRPKKFADYVCNAHTTGGHMWQLKVQVLLQLIPLFPLNHRDICHAIIFVISQS